MPFVLVCGFPSSGKSKRTEDLRNYLSENTERIVHVISDHTLGFDKNKVYADLSEETKECMMSKLFKQHKYSIEEKEVRGKLKSEVQRLLNKDDIVILDSLNYIKGFRYELYCITKACKTPQCVIFCDISKEMAAEWNSKREPETGRYTDRILEELMMRFEEPNSNQRWDSPLIVIHPQDELPYEQISDALFNRKPPPPNMATQNQPLSSTNFLYELDRVTQETVKTIMESQKHSVAGDEISIPGATDKIRLLRLATLAELQRHRRQFITYTKMHPVEDLTRIPNMFVQYINNSLT